MIARALGVAVAVGLGVWAWGAFSVKTIEVQASPEQWRAPVHAWLSSQPWVRRPWVRAATVAEALAERFPMLGGIEVMRVLPDALIVRVRARRAVLLWRDRQRWRWVDEKGVPFPPQGEADLPLVRAPQSALADAARIVNALDASRREALSELVFDGFAWRILFDGGARWLVPARDPAASVRALMAWLARPAWAGRPWWIDATQPRRWFLRPAPVMTRRI